MGQEPILKEIARPTNRVWWQYFYNLESYSQLLRSEAAGNRHFPSVYHLFNEMEDKDGHLYAVLQTRKIGVLSRDRKVVAASDDARAREIADFVSRTLEGIKDFEQALFGLLDAVAKGFTVAEVNWQVEDGRVGISQVKPRFQARFLFGRAGELRLLDPPAEYRHLFTQPGANSNGSHLPGQATNAGFLWGYPVPDKKFLVFTFGSSDDNPYGKGLCLRAYWYYWFKKNNLKFWVIFNEKFGSPTVIGRYRPGTSEEERKRLMEVIESIQSDTGVTVPENVVIEFLEARRAGNINSYKDLADWCNDEVSKIVLGQTLTSSEGRRSGSLALGRVHEQVRYEYIEADAKALMNVINAQLIPWLVYFNFGEGAPLPRFVIDTSIYEQLEQEIEIDRQLVNLGVSLPVRYFYEKYRRPAPLKGEQALRYDDNNLYQYHLQFGVLTINEVRRTLGLPPVAWGDQPPAKVSAEPLKQRQPRGLDVQEGAYEVKEEEIEEE